MSAVRKALEAAGEAVRLRARLSPHTGAALSQDFAAAAIAAFLRALPYHLILADTGGRPVCSGAHWLAAAVEAEGE